jgi:hypothetical protein
MDKAICRVVDAILVFFQMLNWSHTDDVADWDAVLAVLPGCSLYQSRVRAKAVFD